jgi:hypothetical protein
VVGTGKKRGHGIGHRHRSHVEKLKEITKVQLHAVFGTRVLDRRMCEIPGFRRGVVQVFALLGVYAAFLKHRTGSCVTLTHLGKAILGVNRFTLRV